MKKEDLAVDPLISNFLDALQKRLKAGAIEYGNESFFREGTGEQILEELVDVAGWAFVAWVQMRIRLNLLEVAAGDLERKNEPPAETESKPCNLLPPESC